MNRELKFRVFDNYRNRMVTVGVDNNASFNSDGTISTHGVFGKNPIMQYTGLKDKHGKEVYEGDIIKYETSIESGTGYIEFERGFVIIWIEQKTDSPSIMNPLFYFGCSAELEVIGNTFEHPHLLQQ